MNSDQKKRELVFKGLLAQYGWIREESLNAINNQILIINISAIVIGILITASATLWDKEILVPVICGFIGPPASLILSLIWLGQIARMMRAGDYLTEREKEINVLLGVRAITWENYIRNKEAWDITEDNRRIQKKGDKTAQITFPYQFVLCVYLGAAISFIFIDIAWLYTKGYLENDFLSVPLALTGIGLLISVGLFIYLIIFSIKIRINARRRR